MAENQAVFAVVATAAALTGRARAGQAGATSAAKMTSPGPGDRPRLAAGSARKNAARGMAHAGSRASPANGSTNRAGTSAENPKAASSGASIAGHAATVDARIK